MRHAIIILFLSILTATAAGQGVVINEFNSGSPDWVEICNLGATPVDVSGWHVLYFEDTQTPSGVSFTFPGGVVLQPGDCVVVTEDSTLASPVVPSGAPIFWFGTNLTANAGEASSCLLADAQGNGIDYFAFGNPNQLLCPFEAATYLGLPGAPAVPTTFSDPSPGHGISNTLDLHRRHLLADGDDAGDWSMTATIDETPGALNPFQQPAGAASSAPIAAIAALSATSGQAPLTVHFSNRSTGGEAPALVRWDFDLARPGTRISLEHKPSHTFTTAGTHSVGLTIADSAGASVSNVVTISVQPGAVLAPVTTLPFVEDMEDVIDPATVSMTSSGHALYAGKGWNVELQAPGSRVRTLDPRSLDSGYSDDASVTSGPRVAVLDSSSGALATNDVSLSVDMTATGDFRLVYSLYDSFDESNPVDGVWVSDGVSEVRINDWSVTLPVRTWTRFEHLIDAAFLAGNGLVPSSGVVISFRQVDNGAFPVDGLLVDEVMLLPPFPAQPGVPCQPGIACLDVNQAVNANLQPVGPGVGGPFYATAAPGQGIVFEIEGEPNRPVILLAGPLNPGVVTFPLVGQFDIGSPIPTPPFLTGIQAVVDGTHADPLSRLFNTGPTGTAVIAFAVTPPPGFTTAMQAAVGNSATVFRLSNAVQLTIL